MIVSAQPRTFTREDVYAMQRAGILQPDERVELINGGLIRVPPTDPVHSGTVIDLAERFRQHLTPHEVRVREEKDFWLPDVSQLYLPDIAVVRRFDHFTRHPTPEDVHLIIEVAYTSLRSDLGNKLPNYLQAGVPEVWLVDLKGRQVLIHRPEQPVARVAFGQAFAPARFPDIKQVWLP